MKKREGEERREKGREYSRGPDSLESSSARLKEEGRRGELSTKLR